MTLAFRLCAGLAIATIVAYAATPLAIALADRLDFYDRPSGYKAHGSPTPYLGGAAVMAGFAVALALGAGHWSKTAPLLGGVALLWLVGTADDRRTISPWLRLVIEMVLAWLTWEAGLGWSLHMGAAVDLTMTCGWIAGVINAFNLFDNMDGAASTMALAVSAGAGLLGAVRGDAWLAVGAASLGGACLGFLPRNLSPPARIFLGDGGSMPVGFVAAVLVMVAASTSVSAWQSLPVALLLVGMPALDTTLVIVSRRRRGVPVMAGGKDHLTHRARHFMPGPRSVALALGGAQAMVSVVAVLATQGGSSFVVVAAIAYTLAGLVAIAVLEGHNIVGEQAFAVPGEGREVPGVGSAPSGERSPIGLVMLAALGVGAGLSPFFFAYYDASVWAPIGLGLILTCTIGVVARPPVTRAPAVLVVVGVLGTGVWALCSTAWTRSIESATVTGDRWLVYGALLVLLLVLMRSQRRTAMALAAATAGVTIVAFSVLARLLGHDPSALFLGGRLNEPLGYINGEGCLFAMGFWLCMAAAESRRALLAGSGMALATLMACLALLSQSRGTALGMLVALIAVIVLLPGRTRRVCALAVAAAGVALAGSSLLHVYGSAKGGVVSLRAAHDAGGAALLAAVGTGVVWGTAVRAWQVARSHGIALTPLRTAASWALAALVLLGLGLAAGSAGSIEHEANAQWRAFTHLSAPARPAAKRSAQGGGGDTPTEGSSESRSRLLSGGGNRYDYWRIAWGLWREHPLAGVGAGSYAPFYYERRATSEDVEQPHSIELQALGELGLVGGILLLVFFGGVAWGAVKMRRPARISALARGCSVAAVGSFVAWGTQTSVDWMHLLPGLTAIALIGAVALIRSSTSGAVALVSHATSGSAALRSSAAGGSAALAWPRAARSAHGRVLRVVVLATLVVAGGSLSRQMLAQLYADRARSELAANPASAVTDANRSLAIDSDAVQTYYVKAAALARFDQAPAAEAALRQAMDREPPNFVTWALLGDIAARKGSLSVASRYYRRAHALNPRNATLTALSADPSTALR